MNFDLVAFEWASLFGQWEPSYNSRDQIAGYRALGENCQVHVIGTQRGRDYSHFYAVPEYEIVRLYGGVLVIPVVEDAAERPAA
jgi:hypothetical protein